MTSPKNETPALVLALVVTVAIVAGAFWWLKDSSLLGGDQPSSNPDPAGTAQSSGSPPSLADVSDVPNGQFEYGGSTTWAPARGAVDPLIQQTFPSFRLVYKEDPNRAPSSAVGIQMLIDGQLDFAQSSRALNAAEKQQAQQKGLTLQEIPVALEAVAIATHPNLAIPGLTLSQLKDIYTGQLTNWSQVGGPNLAVVPSSRTDDGGTVQFFQEAVLGAQSFAPTVKQLSSTTAALRFVSDTPGAIYFASAPEIVGQCTVAPIPIGTSPQQLVSPYQEPYVLPQDCPTRRNQLNLSAFEQQTYPLTRPLYIVVREGEPQSQPAGSAYAQLLQTEEGGNLLKQAGFVPLSNK
ncbi:MAG: PstS family phosphate ABC transporter substrate-binding protein [Phormidesmis sp.]